ncbi:DUF1127 domain-containing protein [Rhodobacter sp. SGA-6-6]|uniref:DUF1127 domain-containing protein n=1 Tax=Rhodobacter sp. SGA-6-6 TaxID=2710882 RepID=UPI0013EC10A4|nr:DUF1127 domain-containing protein [Rhodobacter sp. SGA-6-6]NGM44894.1 DUF1127 domain-containing protein [Rhodobacter sp. SGA-6-6]
MFTRLVTLLQLRRSTAFLLARVDDRLLDDIGLSRAELMEMHMGISALDRVARANAYPLGKALPVAV